MLRKTTVAAVMAAGALAVGAGAAVATPAQTAPQAPTKVAALQVIRDASCNPSGSSTTQTKPRGYGQWSWDNGTQKYWLGWNSYSGYLYDGTLMYGDSVTVTQGRTSRTYGPNGGYNTYAATPYGSVTVMDFTFKNAQKTKARTCRITLDTYVIG